MYKETHNYTAGTPNNGSTQKKINVDSNFWNTLRLKIPCLQAIAIRSPRNHATGATIKKNINGSLIVLAITRLKGLISSYYFFVNKTD